MLLLKNLLKYARGEYPVCNLTTIAETNLSPRNFIGDFHVTSRGRLIPGHVEGLKIIRAEVSSGSKHSLPTLYFSNGAMLEHIVEKPARKRSKKKAYFLDLMWLEANTNPRYSPKVYYS